MSIGTVLLKSPQGWGLTKDFIHTFHVAPSLLLYSNVTGSESWFYVLIKDRIYRHTPGVTGKNA